jgi:hypothetical protein
MSIIVRIRIIDDDNVNEYNYDVDDDDNVCNNGDYSHDDYYDDYDND